MRRFGFKGEIISFEPLKEMFKALIEVSSKDPKWQAKNIALGNVDDEGSINIAGNSVSSSILDMLPSHIKILPDSIYVGKEKIVIKKLDSVFPDFYKENDNILLKIDTQGFEKNIIDGAEKSLNKIKGIQLEMSIIPLYSGEMLFSDMINYLKDKHFNLFSLENGFVDVNSGQLLQVDGIFYKPQSMQ